MCVILDLAPLVWGLGRVDVDIVIFYIAVDKFHHLRMHEGLKNINDELKKKSAHFCLTFSARPRFTTPSGLDCAYHRSPKTSRKAGFRAANALPLAEVVSMLNCMQL